MRSAMKILPWLVNNNLRLSFNQTGNQPLSDRISYRFVSNDNMAIPASEATPPCREPAIHLPSGDHDQGSSRSSGSSIGGKGRFTTSDTPAPNLMIRAPSS